MTEQQPAPIRLDVDRWMTLRWERGTRFYAVRLEQDLWGQCLITRINGRRGSALGCAVGVPCVSREEGLKRLQQRRETRARSAATTL